MLSINRGAPIRYPLPIQKHIEAFREETGILNREMKQFGISDPRYPEKDFDTFNSLTKNLPDGARFALMETVRTAWPWNLWDRYREVYSVNSTLSWELMKLKDTVKIPLSIFRRLPQPNPLIVLPAEIPFHHPDGYAGRVFGFHVSGKKIVDGWEVLCGTHEDGVDAFQVIMFSEVHTRDGLTMQDIDCTRVTISLSGELTLSEMVDNTLGKRFIISDYLGTEVSKELKREYIHNVKHIAISHLLYICSRNAEIVRAPGRKKSKGKSGNHPVRYSNVGYRMGAAIENTRKRIAQYQDSVPTDRKLPPHIRAAHLHTYRVGPGRQEVELKWLDPIPVNIGKDDGKTVTIHKVK